MLEIRKHKNIKIETDRDNNKEKLINLISEFEKNSLTHMDKKIQAPKDNEKIN